MFHQYFYLLLLGLKVSGESLLFNIGNEYKYDYETLVASGTGDPTPFASSYILKGYLRLQVADKNKILAKFEDLKIGMYNGPWSFFPVPQMKLSSNEGLNSLEEPFRIIFEEGKFKSLAMNDQEPEWASNVKRGVASFLQLDLQKINTSKLETFQTNENSVFGDCPTNYAILPSSKAGSGKLTISKYRNHADCSEIPTRVNFSPKSFYKCSDKTTRDIMNSTAYVIYDIGKVEENLVPNKITILSSLLYWPFTQSGPMQYSYFNMTISLENSGPILVNIPSPENEEVHEDLTYIFDQSDVNEVEDESQDLKVADPFYFHHLSGETDPEILEKTLNLLYERIESIVDSYKNTDVYKDMKKFHMQSPFAIIPLVSTLDYEHLKTAYVKYSEDSKTNSEKSSQFHLFLDCLVMAGTNPSALTIRDILLKTNDPRVMNRLVLTFHLYHKNPSEALAKEMEPIFDIISKKSIDKFTRRLIEISFSNMISRSCKKSLCVTSGLLDKYIDYYLNKLEKSDGIDEQTTAIICLRNLQQGRALDKPLEIAQGKSSYPSQLRFQAIWALSPMLHSPSSSLLREKMLPVFFNRSESCEIRTTVFKLLMGGEPDRRILHEISYYMWTETCPQTLNVVRTYLHYLANTKNPCNKFSADARTIMTYLPPGKIDPIRSGVYGIDFYDNNYGYGHSTLMSVQKSGKTSLPVSIYIGLTNHMSGYASHYFGLFVRMEGLENSVMRKLAALKSANIEKIQNVLSKLGVRNRPSSPLKLEISLLLHGKTIVYFGADEKTISEALPSFLRKLMEHKGVLLFNLERSLLMMGTLYEQPIEIGLPVSILTSLSSSMSINSNINFFSFLNETDIKDSFFRSKLNLFGVSSLNNHMPGIGTKQGIQTLRTLRFRLPLKANFKVLFGSSNKLEFETPEFDYPAIMMIHSTVMTSITADSLNRVNDKNAIALLKQSCPECQPGTQVSKGKEFKKEVKIIKTSKILRGLEGSIEYFDCEREVSRKSLMKQIYSFYWNPKDKYPGIYELPISKSILGFQHERKYLFYSPYGGTCGFKFYISQPKTGSLLKNVKIEANFTRDRDVLEKGRKSIDFQLSGKVELQYSDQTTDTFLANFLMNHPNLDEQMLYLVVSSNFYKICLGVETLANQLPPDPLSYEGPNDPKVIQNSRLKIGHSDGSDLYTPNELPVCPVDIAEIEMRAEGFRSKEQIVEAQSDIFPYKDCKNQMKDEKGKFILPTNECYLAAIQQTNLKNTNYSIKFKVENEEFKRWRKIGRFLNGILSPYISEETELAHIEDDQYYKGEAELTFDLDTQKLDIHYIGKNDVYFKGIDLSFIPSNLQHSELPVRFSPLLLKGFKFGVSGKCLVSLKAVNTFDSVQLTSNLPKCYTLVSGDCGENPQYLILAKTLENGAIGVKLMVGDSYVEFDGSESPSIDGKKQKLSEKIVFTPEASSPFSFVKNGEEIYVYGLGLGLTTTVSIRYTKSFALIVIGSSYRGVQCGLCGHWDSSPYNDNALPNMNCGLSKTNSEFFSSYTVPDGSSCPTSTSPKCTS